MEFVWKDTGTNFLPEIGALAGVGAVEVTRRNGGLEFAGSGWKRTVRLDGATLHVEQSTSLPAETLQGFKRDAVTLKAVRESAQRAVYSLAAEATK
jgi:hypothetical protein